MNTIASHRCMLLTILAALIPVSVYYSASVYAADPPNIVVLFSDDAGYADFGFQPNVRPDMKELTPRIDSIARDGCRFSNAYMSGSVCSPSRAGLMTGRYQQRFGHDNNIPPGYMKGGLPLTEKFGSRRIHDFGYRTGLIGKWHLGYPDAYHPNERGFDFFYGCLQGSRGYFPIENPSPHRVFLENDKPTGEEGYITDRIGEGACRFIRESAGQPFYLFVSFTAPHGPLHVKQEHLDQLAGIENTRRRKNAGLIVSLDENIGKILDCLQEHELTENTLVVFTNDNGGQTQYGANNYPLRGRKGQLWEGGIRVPMAIKWPAQVDAGQVFDDPVISLDLLPTFVEAAQQKIDAAWNLDGTSLMSLLSGKVAALPDRTLFWRRQGPTGAIAARRGDWKLIHLRNEEQTDPKLFNLSDDIGENENLASDHPDIAKELRAAVEEWESGLVEPLWGPKKNGGNRKKKRR